MRWFRFHSKQVTTHQKTTEGIHWDCKQAKQKYIISHLFEYYDYYDLLCPMTSLCERNRMTAESEKLSVDTSYMLES